MGTHARAGFPSRADLPDEIADAGHITGAAIPFDGGDLPTGPRPAETSIDPQKLR